MFGGTFSILHWIVVLAVVLLLFGGRGKVSAIMGDFGKPLELQDWFERFRRRSRRQAIEEAPKAAAKGSTKKAASKKRQPKKATAKKHLLKKP